jgi:hypothetical protein
VADFFATLDLVVAAALRVFGTGFFSALALAVDRLVTFRAFFAGAFAPETRLARDLGRADFGLRGLLLTAAFGADLREADRLIPFVTGLLI